MFCTYLTIYKGSKLPKRYIGSTSIDKIHSGYNGSIQSKKWKLIYREEQKNNKHLFKTRILQKFNSRTEAFGAELDLQIKYNVVKDDLYMNLSLARKNGHFGAAGEDNPMYGKTHTLEVKSKLSEGRKGKRASNETREKMSNSHKRENLSIETIRKMSESRIGEKNHLYGKYGNDHPASNRIVSDEVRQQTSQRMKNVPKSKESIRKRLEKVRKKFIVTYSNGEVEIIHNAKEYCINNGYNYTKFINVANCGSVWRPNGGETTLIIQQIKTEENINDNN